MLFHKHSAKEKIMTFRQNLGSSCLLIVDSGDFSTYCFSYNGDA